MTTSMAVHSGKPELGGEPMKTAAAQSVENANGQISRGCGRFLAAAHTKVIHATRALNGKIKTTERSTLWA
jgi:hypothetical protein